MPYVHFYIIDDWRPTVTACNEYLVMCHAWGSCGSERFGPIMMVIRYVELVIGPGKWAGEAIYMGVPSNITLKGGNHPAVRLYD